jgi:archaellum component FlaF (FlaF/FlaG flagellin family)
MTENDIPEDELTMPVMLAEIQDMATRSVTITINEFLDDGQTIEGIVERMLAEGVIDADQGADYLASGQVVQITANGATEEENIDILGPTLNDAVGTMYFYLKEEHELRLREEE